MNLPHNWHWYRVRTNPWHAYMRDERGVERGEVEFCDTVGYGKFWRYYVNDRDGEQVVGIHGDVDGSDDAAKVAAKLRCVRAVLEWDAAHPVEAKAQGWRWEYDDGVNWLLAPGDTIDDGGAVATVEFVDDEWEWNVWARAHDTTCEPLPNRGEPDTAEPPLAHGWAQDALVAKALCVAVIEALDGVKVELD